MKIKLMKTRILAMLLAVLFVVLAFAACSGATGTSSQSYSSSNAEKSETSEPQASTANEGGETAELHHLTCLVPSNNAEYIKFEERENYSYWAALTEALAEHGVELEFEVIPTDQMQTVSQTRMASGTDLPDYMALSYLDQTTRVRLAKQGMLIPINEIVEHGDGTAKAFLNGGEGEFARKLQTLDDGNQYWFTSVLITTWGDTVCQSPVVPLIRKDWLDAVGLETPQTLDELYEALVAFREQDANGDGTANELVIAEPNFIGNPMAGWFGLGTDLVSVLLDKNEVVCPWYQEEEMKAYITWMKRLVDGGVFDLATVGDETDIGTQMMMENKVSLTMDYATERYLEPTINTGDGAAAEYVPVGPITGLEGKDSYLTGDAAELSYQYFGFTKACEDLEGAAALLDFFCTDEYTKLYEWGVEGETYEIIEGQPQFLEGIGQAYWQEMAQNGLATGLWIHYGILPRMYPGQDLKISEAEAGEAKLDYMDRFAAWEHKALTSGYERYYMALPTDEETEISGRIYTDLKTCSDETFVNLISGRYSLDDYDKYVQEMKDLGLDEYLEMMKGRYERYANS